jgi:hypothetical protein
MDTWNDFLKSVILRISEARDLGEVDRFGFYDHTKTFMATPPDVFRVNAKYVPQHSVLNVCGPIITTNHKTDGIYLPPDDRRHYVAWSERKKEDFIDDYWNKIWRWYESGGDQHVAAYLATLDISEFDAKAPPPKTPEFWAIVDANRAPEDAELCDVLDALGNPRAVVLSMLVSLAHAADDPGVVTPATAVAPSADGKCEPILLLRPNSFAHWLRDRKNRRTIPHRLERAGYVPVRNSAAKDGLWKVNGLRQVIYAQRDLPLGKQLEAARELQQDTRL